MASTKLAGGAVVDAVAVAAPGINPMAVSGCEGVAGYTNYVSYIALGQKLVPVALGVPEIYPAAVLGNKECGAEAFDFSHVGSG